MTTPGHNRPNEVTISIDRGDVPMLAEALGHAATRAMMLGSNDSKERLRQLSETLASIADPGARHFNGRSWCEIVRALHADGAATWSVAVRRPHWLEWTPRNRNGRIHVRVDDHEWCGTAFDVAPDDPAVEEVRNLLAELAPIGVEEAPFDTTENGGISS